MVSILERMGICDGEQVMATESDTKSSDLRLESGVDVVGGGSSSECKYE